LWLACAAELRRQRLPHGQRALPSLNYSLRRVALAARPPRTCWKVSATPPNAAVSDALSEEDEADGYILACQAHATEDVSIDA
jgi:hypothetical protein